MLRLEYNQGMALGHSEKVSINVGAVDIGQVDLLVEQGLYSNRSDFFRTAIRNQVKSHEQIIQQNMAGRMISLGIIEYSKETLEEYAASNQKLNISIIGMGSLADDVTPELALATIAKVKVFGSFKCSPAVHDAIKDRIMK